MARRRRKIETQGGYLGAAASHRHLRRINRLAEAGQFMDVVDNHPPVKGVVWRGRRTKAEEVEQAAPDVSRDAR